MNQTEIKIKAMKITMGKRVAMEAHLALAPFGSTLEKVIEVLTPRLEEVNITLEDIKEVYTLGEQGDHRIGRLMESLLTEVKFEMASTLFK